MTEIEVIMKIVSELRSIQFTLIFINMALWFILLTNLIKSRR